MSRSLGRYRVVRPIGEGATAEVFEVEDPRLGVRRALKILHPEVARNDELRARFDAEARTLAQIHHPNLVSVHDVGETDGRPWMVMDLAEGGSLAERVARHGPLAPEHVLHELLGVLDALAMVHAAGVIHRDIKPQNLLYDGDGNLRLADFGIALTSGVELTRTGMVLGSWGFMAPEQRLDPRKVRPATDLFGVAASAVWAIVGGPVSDLHVGEHRAVLLRDVSDDVSGVLHRALAFRPEERFRSAGEMRAAVEGVLGTGSDTDTAAAMPVVEVEEHARGSSEGGPAPLLARVQGGQHGKASPYRAPWRSGALGVVTATVVAGGAGAWFGLQDEVRARFVDETEAVRQARALAAIPTCPDTPTRWERRGSPRWSTSVPGGREAGGGTAADIDGDGHKDLLFVHALEEEFRIYWGTGSDFDDTPTRVPAKRMSWGMPRVGDAGDIDGDGDLDLVGVALEDRGFVIARNEGGRRFGQVSTVDSGEVPAELRVVDWDLDGKSDLIFTTVASGERYLRWRRSKGDGTFDTILDLTDDIDAFDIELDAASRPTAVQYLRSGEILRAERRADSRLSEAKSMLRVPLAHADTIRVGGERTTYVWDVAQRDRTALRASRAGVSTRPTPCAFQLVGAPGTNDIVDFDDDGVEDTITAASCSYCTSSYRLYLGNR